LVEIKRQVDSLKRQANKANKYMELKKRIELHEVVLLKDEFLVNAKRYESISTQHTKLLHQLKPLQQELSILEKDVEKFKIIIREKQNNISTMEKNIHKIELNIQEINNQQVQKNERERYILSQLKDINNQLQNNKNNMTELEDELKKKLFRKDELEGKLKEMKIDIDKNEKRLKTLQIQRENKMKKLEELKAEVVDNLSRLSQLKNQVTKLKVEYNNFEVREKRIETELKEYMNKHQKIENDKKVIQEQIEQNHQKLIQLKEEIANYQKEKDSVQKELNAINTQLSQLTNKKYTISGRLHTLQKLQENFKGYPDGVKIICKAKLKGVCGLLSEYIDIPEEYEKAVEAALDEWFQGVIIQKILDAEQIISYLKAKNAERVNLLLSTGIKKHVYNHRDINEPGVIGWMSELIKVDVKYQELVKYLVGDVLIVDNISTGMNIITNNPDVYKTVTLDGQFIDSFRIKCGMPKKARVELISRKNEIAKLQQQEVEFENKLQILQQEKVQQEKVLTDINNRLDNVNIEMYSLEIGIANMKTQLDNMNKEEKNIKNILITLTKEKELIAKEKEENVKQREILSKEETKLTSDDHEYRRLVDTITAELHKIEAELETYRARVTDMKVTSAEVSQQQYNLTQDIEKTNITIHELQENINKLNQQILQLTKEKEKNKTQSSDYTHKLDTLMKDKNEYEQRLSILRDEYEIQEKGLLDKEEKIKHIRYTLEQIKEELHKLDIEKTQAKLNMDNIMHRLVTEFKRTPEDITRDNVTILSSEAREQILEELRQDKARLKDMGTVNLTAPEEYEELKKRYEFIVEQNEDMQKAKHDLNALIKRIDTTTSSLFKEAFEVINKNFTDTFQRLFDGGYGELRQIGNSNNIDDIGIEIVAQPQGKKLSSISLLSGGERALTAICLLFAIFNFKPSPFSILDEVDAALDEPNVLRFNRFLIETSKSAQFILITHNPRTIETADTLYGITMEEPGVSKIVSVRLKKQNK
jgi:chromosome segregation protein